MSRIIEINISLDPKISNFIMLDADRITYVEDMASYYLIHTDFGKDFKTLKSIYNQCNDAFYQMITGAKYVKSIIPASFDCYDVYQDLDQTTIQKCVGFATCADGHVSAIDFCDGEIQLANSFSNYKGTYTRKEIYHSFPSIKFEEV